VTGKEKESLVLWFGPLSAAHTFTDYTHYSVSYAVKKGDLILLICPDGWESDRCGCLCVCSCVAEYGAFDKDARCSWL